MVFSPTCQAQRAQFADALSLVTINDVHILIDYQALAYEQQQDHHTAITNLQWQYISIDGTKLLCDVKTGRSRHIGSKKFHAEYSTPYMGYPTHQYALPSN